MKGYSVVVSSLFYICIHVKGYRMCTWKSSVRQEVMSDIRMSGCISINLVQFLIPYIWFEIRTLDIMWKHVGNYLLTSTCYLCQAFVNDFSL